MLTLGVCYLTWTVTYLAQVHPLERKYAKFPALEHSAEHMVHKGPRRSLVKE